MSYDPDSDPSPLTYQWDLNGDAVADYTDADPTVDWTTLSSFGYTFGGSYSATLTVSDGIASDSDTAQISVAPNEVPVANAGGTYNMSFGSSLFLMGSGSYDMDCLPLPLSYEWDLDGDAVADYTATDPTIDWTTLVGYGYTFGGTFTATLTVNDSMNSDADVAQISVAPNQTPIAIIDGSASITLLVGDSLNLTGSNSYDPDGVPAPLTYKWDVNGDAVIDSSSADPNLDWTTLSASFGYAGGQTKTVSLIVNDGLIDSLPATVQVVIPMPITMTVQREAANANPIILTNIDAPLDGYEAIANYVQLETFTITVTNAEGGWLSFSGPGRVWQDNDRNGEIAPGDSISIDDSPFTITVYVEPTGVGSQDFTAFAQDAPGIQNESKTEPYVIDYFSIRPQSILDGKSTIFSVGQDKSWISNTAAGLLESALQNKINDWKSSLNPADPDYATKVANANSAISGLPSFRDEMAGNAQSLIFGTKKTGMDFKIPSTSVAKEALQGLQTPIGTFAFDNPSTSFRGIEDIWNDPKMQALRANGFADPGDVLKNPTIFLSSVSQGLMWQTNTGKMFRIEVGTDLFRSDDWTQTRTCLPSRVS